MNKSTKRLARALVQVAKAIVQGYSKQTRNHKEFLEELEKRNAKK